MIKIQVLLFISCLLLVLEASVAKPSSDRLSSIMQMHNKELQEQELVKFILDTFDHIALKDFKKEANRTNNALINNQIKNRTVFSYFIEDIYQRRTKNPDGAEANLRNAINESRKINDQFLLYTFYSHLAFLQTNRGNTIGAIMNFRHARKAALLCHQPRLEVLLGINVSDLYYRSQLYDQSLSSLDKAQALFNEFKLGEARLQYVLWYNKAENFFRTGNIDSLKVYHAQLASGRGDFYMLYTFARRTAYYLALLSGRYASVVEKIKQLKKDSLYRYSIVDEQNLGEAFYKAGDLDSAKMHLMPLIESPEIQTRSEIKPVVLERLAQIATIQDNYQDAVGNYQSALNAYHDYTGRLVRVGDISSQIGLDDALSAYQQKENEYLRQRLWLTFGIALVLLILVAGFMINKAIRKKRYYEQLVFKAKSDELAFIHSHEVRRHLSNIMGIIGIIKDADNSHAEFDSSVNYLIASADNLDNAIRNISEKLGT